MLSMRSIIFSGAAAAVALVIGMGHAPTASAAECTTDKKRDEITAAEAQALYDCIADSLIEGYSKATDVPGVADYRNWKLVTTAPLVSTGSSFSRSR